MDVKGSQDRTCYMILMTTFLLTSWEGAKGKKWKNLRCLDFLPGSVAW